MEINTICKIIRRYAPTAVLSCILLCLSVALTACGNNAAQDSTSNASGNTRAQMASEIYIPVRIATIFSEGKATQIVAFTFDDQGRPLETDTNLSSPDYRMSIHSIFNDWDEFGHPLAFEQIFEDIYGAISISVKTDELDLDDSGFLSSYVASAMINKEEFAEGEVALEKQTQTCEYGEDASLYRKVTVSTDCFDVSEQLLSSQTKTYEYDENGLQTVLKDVSKSSDGSDHSVEVEISWTMDDDGKPISFEYVSNEPDMESKTVAGDVTLNEQGMISKIGNITLDGEAVANSVTISYQKIENPLHNGYEGWRNFALTDCLFAVI